MKRFKNSLFFVSLVFLLVFSLGVVIAGDHYTYQCSDDQVIFKISDTTNAHGEFYVDGTGDYGTEICHDEIFGYDGVRGVSGETILKLSSVTNAHGELSSAENYEYDVFFGQVECTNRPLAGAGDVCIGEEKELVRMACNSGDSNCMFGAYGSGYFAGAYDNYAICCTSQNLENAEWWNLFNDEIDSSAVGDRIRIHVDTPGFHGLNVEFEFWEDDGMYGNDDLTEFVNDRVAGNIEEFTVSGNYVAFDFVLDEDDLIDIADDGTDCGDGLELFYSVKDLAGNIPETVSEKLTVQCNSNNANPIANITNPVNGEIYLAQTYEIVFGEESIDEDDYIVKWEWEIIQDGNLIYENTTEGAVATGGNHFGTVTFSEGQATVKLTVTDERGATSIDEITLVILEEDGGAGALIGLGNGDDFFDLAVEDVVMWVSGGRVVFNGTDSYVISYGGSCTLTCEAGVCPDIDEINIPTANCGGTVIIEDEGNLDFDGVLFEWDFNDAEIASASGTPLTEVIRYYHSLVSNDRKDKLSSLRISWSGGEVTLDGFGEKEFTLGQCINNGNTYLDVEYGAVTPYPTTTEPGYCNLAPYGDELGQCCPLGMYCSDSGTGVCLIIPTGVEACTDYTSQSDCEEDEYNAAVNDPAGEGMSCPVGTIPGEFECTWNVLGQNCDLTLPCGDPIEGCVDFICSYDYTRTECGADGYMEVTYTTGACVNNVNLCNTAYCADGSFEADCPGGTENVPCGRLNFELGFFEYAHFFAATLIISLVYLSIYWRREEK